jgi:3-oxoacyl-[acyl-carrier protein] reductase
VPAVLACLPAEIGADGVTAKIIRPRPHRHLRISFLDQQKAGRRAASVAGRHRPEHGLDTARPLRQPQEYADVVAFLASEQAPYVTGSLFRIDGGMLGNI